MGNFSDAPGSVEDFAIGLSDADYEGVWQWSSAMDDDSCKYPHDLSVEQYSKNRLYRYRIRRKIG